MPTTNHTTTSRTEGQNNFYEWMITECTKAAPCTRTRTCTEHKAVARKQREAGAQSHPEPDEPARSNDRAFYLASQRVERARCRFEKANEALPKLELEQVDRLMDLIKGDNEAIRDRALVLLWDNVTGHSSDENYTFDVAGRARDRALYQSELAQRGIRAFADEATYAVLDVQLTDWEKGVFSEE